MHNALIKKRFNVFYRMLIEFSLKKQQSQGLIAFYSILIDILNRFLLWLVTLNCLDKIE